METLHCLALRTVKVSDSRNLLSVWSREHGRLTFAMPAGKSREATRRRALTMPLSLFEGMSNVNMLRDVQTIRDICAIPSAPLPPGAMPTALFLTEVLDLLLRRSEPDDALSDYLFDAAATLGTLNGTALIMFHILFLYRLTIFAGIEPDSETYTRGSVFDMREGIFRLSPPLHPDYIAGMDCRVMYLLGALRPGSAAIRLNHEGRKRATDLLIRYYTLHHTPLTSLKSLDTLRQLS